MDSVAADTGYDTTSWHHHAPGNRSGYARRGFPFGSWLIRGEWRRRFPSGLSSSRHSTRWVMQARWTCHPDGVFRRSRITSTAQAPFRHRVAFTEYTEVMRIHSATLCGSHRIFTAIAVIVQRFRRSRRGSFSVRLAGVAQHALLGDGFL